MPTFDWVFMGAGNLFVFFCLLLVVTPFGRVRLGGADARPDYSRSAWFAILETLPLAHTASFLGLVLVVVFFVTSSDSGSLVIDTITAGGKLDTPIAQRVFWCVFEGLVAIALHGGQDRLTRHAHLSPAAFPGKVPVQKGTYAQWRELAIHEERKATRTACRYRRVSGLHE